MLGKVLVVLAEQVHHRAERVAARKKGAPGHWEVLRAGVLDQLVESHASEPALGPSRDEDPRVNFNLLAGGEFAARP